MNLAELYFEDVRINEEKFIEFLRQRPSIKVFHHDCKTFSTTSQREVFQTLAKYCGDQIREYHGETDLGIPGASDFLSGFTNVTYVYLTSYQTCGGDLVNALKRLAEHDTLETLRIKYDCRKDLSYETCIFQERPNHDGSDMSPFRHFVNCLFVANFIEC